MSENTLILDSEDMSLLRTIQNDARAIDQFIKMTVSQGESRLSELNQRQREAWTKIAKKYELDLRREDWALKDDGSAIVKVQQRYEY